MDTSTLAKNPAYMEYPADILNNEKFMRMTLAQRGLYWTLRMYCWKNGSIPGSGKKIAELVKVSESVIAKNLTPDVLSFFTPSENMQRLFCHDLEAYREVILNRQQKRSDRGRAAADKRWHDSENASAITQVMDSDVNLKGYASAQMLN